MKKILFLLMLPFAAMAQNNLSYYKSDSVFSITVTDPNYLQVDITPVQITRGDTFSCNTITIYSILDLHDRVVVDFQIGTSPEYHYTKAFTDPIDYQGYLRYRWKYVFWLLSDVYSLNIK
jgi:hypothetical protein